MTMCIFYLINVVSMLLTFGDVNLIVAFLTKFVRNRTIPGDGKLLR